MLLKSGCAHRPGDRARLVDCLAGAVIQTPRLDQRRRLDQIQRAVDRLIALCRGDPVGRAGGGGEALDFGDGLVDPAFAREQQRAVDAALRGGRGLGIVADHEQVGQLVLYP
jgi:hypothetical protein